MRSGTGLEDRVERGLGGPAEAGEPGLSGQLAEGGFAGLVEPEWELRRLTAELAELDELTEVS